MTRADDQLDAAMREQRWSSVSILDTAREQVLDEGTLLVPNDNGKIYQSRIDRQGRCGRSWLWIGGCLLGIKAKLR